ncbi:MAG: hypothetical protein D6732_00445, partial [Methanobacteriota archaeon]
IAATSHPDFDASKHITPDTIKDTPKEILMAAAKQGLFLEHLAVYGNPDIVQVAVNHPDFDPSKVSLDDHCNVRTMNEFAIEILVERGVCLKEIFKGPNIHVIDDGIFVEKSFQIASKIARLPEFMKIEMTDKELNALPWQKRYILAGTQKYAERLLDDLSPTVVARAITSIKDSEKLMDFVQDVEQVIKQNGVDSINFKIAHALARKGYLLDYFCMSKETDIVREALAHPSFDPSSVSSEILEGIADSFDDPLIKNRAMSLASGSMESVMSPSA